MLSKIAPCQQSVPWSPGRLNTSNLLITVGHYTYHYLLLLLTVPCRAPLNLVTVAQENTTNQRADVLVGLPRSGNSTNQTAGVLEGLPRSGNSTNQTADVLVGLPRSGNSTNQTASVLVGLPRSGNSTNQTADVLVDLPRSGNSINQTAGVLEGLPRSGNSTNQTAGVLVGLPRSGNSTNQTAEPSKGHSFFCNEDDGELCDLCQKNESEDSSSKSVFRMGSMHVFDGSTISAVPLEIWQVS